MRPSKKHEILAAAVALIEADNLDAVSYDALAQATGMSKSGILYHFPSRYEIMRGIHQYLADQWEHELERIAGGSADTVDAAGRLRAVVLAQSNSATKAELLLEVDARTNPEFSAVWKQVDERWTPTAEGIADDDALRTHYLVKVLADGLWLHDHVHEEALTSAQREALTNQILQMLE